MTGNTNYTPIPNNAPMQGPAQITSVFEHFDPLVGESCATYAALPDAEEAWTGRTVFVVSEGVHRIYNGTDWVVSAADTGWVPLTIYGSGFTAYGNGWDGIKVRKVNGIVHMNGAAVNLGQSWTATKPIAALPPGFTPTRTVPGINCAVSNNGNIYPTGSGQAGGAISLSASWLIG